MRTQSLLDAQTFSHIGQYSRLSGMIHSIFHPDEALISLRGSEIIRASPDPPPTSLAVSLSLSCTFTTLHISCDPF